MTAKPTRRETLAGIAATIGIGIQPADSLADKRVKHAHAGDMELADQQLVSRDAPLQVFVSTRWQRLDLYAGTKRIGSCPVSSGQKGHETPHGIFTILGKRRYHRSNIYSGAPMPFMHRLTWSGIALHEGNLPGYPASHGCVRMPGKFARHLFTLDTVNRHVVITRDMPRPRTVAGFDLFQPQHHQTGHTDSGDRGEPAVQSQNPANEAALRIFLTRRTGRHRLRNAQEILQALGYYSADLDGLMGPKTWHALHAFQKAANMRTTGVLSGATEQVLEAAYGIEERPEGHLYVRQDQKPLFDMPVQIDQTQKPLGHHVLTAGRIKRSGSRVDWNAVSLDRPDPGSALAALRRFRIPASARSRIEQLLTSFSSIVISDAGLGPETGKGTDFIVIYS
jgi:peptidoglycan hydrolase-like protein with peptidoglycan-binding domain